jgi:hypothetical protein
MVDGALVNPDLTLDDIQASELTIVRSAAVL